MDQDRVEETSPDTMWPRNSRTSPTGIPEPPSHSPESTSASEHRDIQELGDTSEQREEHEIIQNTVETTDQAQSPVASSGSQPNAVNGSEGEPNASGGSKTIGEHITNGLINHRGACYAHVVWQFFAVVMSHYGSDKFFGKLGQACETMVVEGLTEADRSIRGSQKLVNAVEKIQKAIDECYNRDAVPEEASVAKHLRILLEDMRMRQDRFASPLLFLLVFASSDRARSHFDGPEAGHCSKFWESLVEEF